MDWPKRISDASAAKASSVHYNSQSKRKHGLFPNLSSTTSDSADDDDDVPQTSDLAAKAGNLRFVGKHARPRGETSSPKGKGKGKGKAKTTMPDRAARLAKRNETRDVESESESSSSKPRDTPVVAVAVRVSGRKSAGSASKVTTTITTIPTASQHFQQQQLAKKLAASPNDKGKESDRSARARTRGNLREHPHLDEDERKALAGAGVLRSGRVVSVSTERMPVTGPPIPLVPSRNKRKRVEDGDASGNESDARRRAASSAALSGRKSLPPKRVPKKRKDRRQRVARFYPTTTYPTWSSLSSQHLQSPFL